MQHLPKWCNEASYHHWIQAENECPNWTDISNKLFSEGKLLRLKIHQIRKSTINFLQFSGLNLKEN